MQIGYNVLEPLTPVLEESDGWTAAFVVKGNTTLKGGREGGREERKEEKVGGRDEGGRKGRRRKLEGRTKEEVGRKEGRQLLLWISFS